jgi:hypothetical protein
MPNSKKKKKRLTGGVGVLRPIQEQKKVCLAMPFHSTSYHNDPYVHPTTAFILSLSKNPLKSSFRISITHASKLSILTLAPVSLTTS